MVKPLPSIFLCAAVMMSFSASAKPKPLIVSSITVSRTGIYEPAKQEHEEIKAACQKFSVKENNVAKWIRKSKQIDRNLFWEAATITECTAEGSLTTKDKKEYHWTLDMGGSAILKDQDHHTIYLIGGDVDY
ncbi:MAG: hypothetical protein PW843_23115 [Azospirillaceae bacterium]|nr:hypothetical protein [Azospirillaceae bacterium]